VPTTTGSSVTREQSWLPPTPPRVLLLFYPFHHNTTLASVVSMRCRFLPLSLLTRMDRSLSHNFAPESLHNSTMLTPRLGADAHAATPLTLSLPTAILFLDTTSLFS